MKLKTEKQEKYSTIKVEEEKLNTLNAPELKSEFVVLNSEGVKNIILDLGKVTFVDSSGLSAILTANRLCKNSNGTLVLVNLQDNVQKLIKISQLDNILNIVPSTKEAIDFVLMEEVEREVKDNNE